MADSNEALVRPARDGDEDAVRKLFTKGMWDTVVINGQRKFRELAVSKLYLSGTFSLLLANAIQVVVPGMEGWRSMSYVVSVVVTVMLCSLVPWLIWKVYVFISIRTDLAGKLEHYRRPAENELWVAQIQDNIVGCVAVEKANSKKVEFGFSWSNGDAELRRMSVSEDARGKGVARKLFETLKAFCEEKKYNRIVLSTSEFQKVAYEKFYPKLGFEVDHEGLAVCFSVRFYSLKIK